MKLLEKLDKAATTRNTIIAFVLYSIVGIVLTYMEMQLGTTPQIDFHFHGYNPQNILDIFNAYGPQGRNFYFWVTVVDTLLPFVVAFFCTFYYAFTYRKWGVQWLGNFLIICSLLFMIFDLLENSFIFSMLHQYPEISTKEVAISSYLTQIKLRTVIIIYSMLPVTFLISIFRMVKNRKDRNQNL